MQSCKPLENESGIGEKYIAINGCPSKCASKEFGIVGIKPHEEIVITNGDPTNNEKYEELLYIDEEVALVQEVIDKILAGK